jgi:cytoskeletal protein RodZ
MTETTYTSEMITAYLLGSLSAEETERLDELSVTDESFADALLAAESELVDAYALKQLGEEARQKFEKNYLRSPQRRETARFAQALQQFGERQIGLSSRNPSAGEVQKRSWFSSLKTFFSPRAVLQWGLACVALVLLVAAGWLMFQNMRLRQQMLATQARNDDLTQREQQLQMELEARQSTNVQSEQESARTREELEHPNDNATRDRTGGPPASLATVLSLTLTPQLRSNTQIPTVSVQPATTRIAMQLGLEPNPNSNYRVLLVDQVDHQTVWRSSLLKSHSNASGEAVDVSFPARLLKPRTYVLRVMGVGANGAAEVISDYSFRVVK